MTHQSEAEKRKNELLMLILSITDEAYEIAKELGHGFEIKTTIAPEAYGYPPGTTAASFRMPPGYEYDHFYNGHESLRFKHSEISIDRIRPGEKPK